MLDIQMAEFDVIEEGAIRMYANGVNFFVKPRPDGKFGYNDGLNPNGRRIIILYGTITVYVRKGRDEDAEDTVTVFYKSTPIADFDAPAFNELDEFINKNGGIFVNVSEEPDEDPRAPSGGRRKKTRKGKAKLQ